MVKSVEFNWEIDSIDNDVILTQKDEAMHLFLKHMNNEFTAKILEAGCGNGRVVKYLYDLGFKNVEGIELNKKIVVQLNQKFKSLNIYHGDLMEYNFNETFNYIISFGVVEHFIEGIDAPMEKLYQLLKEGGKAILTVPCFNYYRRLRFYISIYNPKNWNRDKNLPSKKGFLYHVSPLYGIFFEYWTTPKEFNKICIKSGFKIIESKPISHAQGLMGIFGKRIGQLNNGEIQLNKFGRLINKVLKIIPFLHNHMYAVVLEKNHSKSTI